MLDNVRCGACGTHDWDHNENCARCGMPLDWTDPDAPKPAKKDTAPKPAAEAPSNQPPTAGG